MTKVIDSSVLLAAILGERGGEVLSSRGDVFHLSMVNLAEVYTKIVERGGSIADVEAFMQPLPIRIRAFREAHAMAVASLRPRTMHRGLSLGDRACLGLAMLIDLPVLTADTKWAELDLGIDIRLIR